MAKFVSLFYLLFVFHVAVRAQATVDSVTESYYAPLKFRSIGPFRGGRSVTATGVVGDPLTYYMGTTGGGLWKTSDAGQRWHNISDGYFKTGSVGAIAVSRSNPQVVYVGMGEHAPRGVMTTHGDGMYKSTDAGKSWVHLGLEQTQHISRVVIHPQNPDIVYVAAQGQLYGPNEERGVYRTLDGGTNWERILYVNDLTGASELSLDPNNTQVLYAAMWHHQRLPWQVVSGGPGSGLYKSTDGGTTWKELTEGLPAEKGKMAISVSPANSDRVYALVESDSQQEKGGLFMSEDAGARWTRVSKDHRLVQRAWYYLELFTDPVNEHLVYVLSASPLRSIDGGKSWETLDGSHSDYHDLWINPDNPRNLCIANDGGAAISFDNGSTWSTQDLMPTGQYYRLNVDNQHPYRIYAGQQDNTSVSIASRSTTGSGITNSDWTASAGGESAFLAFDPDNPRYVLGGSYLGTIEVLDNEAKASTNVMAAPIQYLGRAASDMKYRFNWNAPIIWSRHEPNTYYHAGQHLLRTRDLGQTWEEASPDLTRNQIDKQIKGGGPYTVEAVGAENYGTISYVADAPTEAGALWVGTDDGYVQLSRDGGTNWTNVTPAGLKECLVNAIDVSPHQDGTAFIATTRYKFNDYTPLLYKTTDYGVSWTNITGNLPYGAYTRVVRQDTEDPNLLFAGTETGLFISRNGGGEWQLVNLNLPVTPITDLLVAHDDLIVATSGRSIWILDDLELMRQTGTRPAAVTLYAPAPAMLGTGGSTLDDSDPTIDGTDPTEGVNPASGVVLYYHLPEAQDSAEVTLSIQDAAGNLVIAFSSQPKAVEQFPGGPPEATTLPTTTGLNRFVWDMRYPNMIAAPTAYLEGSFRGHKVAPGTYTAILKADGKASSTMVVIEPNPNYDLTDQEYATYHTFMQAAEANLSEMHTLVNQLREVSGSLEGIRQRASDSGQASLDSMVQSLQNDIRRWDEQMVQRKSQAYDDVENFENKFTANYLFVINHAGSGLPRVNQASRERLEELEKEWGSLKAVGEELLRTRVPALNERLWKVGIGAIRTVPQVK